MRAGILLAVLLAGCAAPASPFVYGGDDCHEVALELAAPAGAAPPLADGFAPHLRDGAAVVAIAFNACTYSFGDVRTGEADAFVWLALDPPAGLRLPGNASHAWELAHWREPGRVLDALREKVPGLGEARFTGTDLRAGEPFAWQVDAAEGVVRLEGVAGNVTETLRHGAGPCCRVFHGPDAWTDYVASDQPFGTAPCALSTTLPWLQTLLGARAEGPCVHNAGYRFQAEVRRT